MMVIGFSKPKKFKLGAWLISKWIGKSYSHVYIRYNDTQGRDMVFQAGHGLVHQLLFTNFVLENYVVREIEIFATDAQKEEFRDYYYKHLGEPYDYKDLVLIPINDTLWALKKPYVNSNGRGYICSELASEMLNHIFNVKFNKPFNLCRPDDEKALG